MSFFFPLQNKKGGFCSPCSLRIVKKLNIDKSDLRGMEVVISRDLLEGTTLVGSPNAGGKTRYDGRLYEELLKLEFNSNISKNLNVEDKRLIMDFVSKFSRPYLAPEEAYIHFRINPTKSNTIVGDKINWLFINFLSNPDDQHKLDFFYYFRAAYNDFVDTYQIIKSGNFEKINSINNALDTYRNVFNSALLDSHLYLPSSNEDYKTTWMTTTSISQCYLELYEILMSTQQIKACKYCGEDFVSGKSNRFVCDNCRTNNLYRILYNERNKDEENRKARERMRSIREKQSKLEIPISD